MISGISMTCFFASYAVALALEAWRLFPQIGAKLTERVRSVGLPAIAGAGLVAHTLYLAHRAATAHASPLSSPYDWCLLAAWALAVIYFVFALIKPATSVGLFLLPAVMALLGAALLADEQPFAQERASRVWLGVHGSVLLLGTVSVIVGFIAGLMYLVQSYRLKHKRIPSRGLKLPSLEWLERANSRALLLSIALVGIGFVSGIVLNLIKHQNEAERVPWTDPVVVLTDVMFAWLAAAGIFSLVYKPARQGRKVAYLTIASLIFLAITLWAVLRGNTQHGGSGAATATSQAATSHLVPTTSSRHDWPGGAA